LWQERSVNIVVVGFSNVALLMCTQLSEDMSE
jgi:hypothetical protein